MSVQFFILIVVSFAIRFSRSCKLSPWSNEQNCEKYAPECGCIEDTSERRDYNLERCVNVEDCVVP